MGSDARKKSRKLPRMRRSISGNDAARNALDRFAAVLSETGVTYYDVPQSFGITPYRYTVVNGRTVLVEPRTRRIVQVIE